MTERIKELEAIARQLEPDREQRKQVRDQVINYTEDFLDNIYDLKAYEISNKNPNALFESPISEEPDNIENLLPFLKEHVDTPGLNPASGGHLGYIPGGGIYISSLGDYMADITNRYAGVYFAGQGAVQMENMLIRWLADLIGYPDTAGGNHASGGSIANLIGIVTARDAHGLEAKDYHKAVIYLSEQVHHCMDKAFRIAGLGNSKKRYLPMDEGYRIIPSELEKAIKEDKKQGLIPWMVVASAGTTDVGAVDPLDEIGQIANDNNLWYHIDGAYGAFFILCPECQEVLKGMDRSDSIVMDAHKGLFLPYGLGTVLVRDKMKLHKSHYFQANYMQDTKGIGDLLSPAELSPELTKHFRGLRLWLPLKLHGIKPFRACLQEKLALTQYFHDEIQKIPGFEVCTKPELSVATYRFVPPTGDANEFNARLIKEVHKDGRVFMSSTTLNGQFILRMTALSFRTHLDIVDTALEVLKDKSVYLLNQ